MSASTDANTLRPTSTDVGVHRSQLLEDEAVCMLYKALEARNGLNAPILHGISLAYSFGSASPLTMRNMGIGGQVQSLPLRSKMMLLTLSMAFCDAQDADAGLQQDVLDYIVTFRNLVQDAWNEDEAIVEKAERELAKDVAYVIAFGIISYANLSHLVEQDENERTDILTGLKADVSDMDTPTLLPITSCFIGPLGAVSLHRLERTVRPP